MRPQRRQPTRPLRPWDSPGKNTGVGCHFLLQCMKVKSEGEVTQLCPTFCDPMYYSLPGSPVHGILQARILEWVASGNALLQEIFLTQGSNLSLLHCRHILLPYEPPGKPKVKALVTQLCPTFCNQMDCNLPGPSVHGILQARILEWVAIPFSGGYS